jgi:hypothetical protein
VKVVVLASHLLFTGEDEGKITGEGSATQGVRGIKFTKELGFLPPHLTSPPVGQRDAVARHRFA